MCEFIGYATLRICVKSSNWNTIQKMPTPKVTAKRLESLVFDKV